MNLFAKHQGLFFGHVQKMESSPHNGKKPMCLVPVFKKKKKNIKQEVKNYRRISLLSVSSKIFERLLYESIFKLFTEPSLISQNQSGFKQADSCTVTSSCQLRIKSTNLLMTVMKFDLCSQTYLNLLIRYDAKALFSN